MAVMVQNPLISVEIRLTLMEHEARALALLASYSHDMLVKLLADNTSSEFTGKHKFGITEFLVAVKRDVPSILHRLDEAKSVFEGTKVAAAVPRKATTTTAEN